MTLLKRFRKISSHRRARALPLEELLERAGVPRSAPPELLAFARFAGVTMEEPDPKPDPDPAPDPKPDPAPDPKPDPDPDPKPDPTPAGKKVVDEGEYHRLQRIASEKAEADRKRKREEDEAAGRHAEVVESVEQERETEKSARETVEAEKAELELNITVRDVASRLKFIDAADARLHLPENTPNDPKEVERALKKVAEEKSYLIGGQGSRTGAPGGGGDPIEDADIDEQIREAEKAGDTAKSIRLKRIKAAQQQAAA